jgi:hypothetical protein
MGNLSPGMPTPHLKGGKARRIRRSPNDVGHTRPQPGRDPPESVVAIARYAQSCWASYGYSDPARCEELRPDYRLDQVADIVEIVNPMAALD